MKGNLIKAPIRIYKFLLSPLLVMGVLSLGTAVAFAAVKRNAEESFALNGWKGRQTAINCTANDNNQNKEHRISVHQKSENSGNAYLVSRVQGYL